MFEGGVGPHHLLYSSLRYFILPNLKELWVKTFSFIILFLNSILSLKT
jgi:hypothetical protein